MKMLELEEKIIEWQKMPRNNQEELNLADEFFDKELMPLSLEAFLKEQKEKIKNKYYGMILTLGTSWQPLALSIALLKPQKILVLCTQDTYCLIEKIIQFLKIDKASVHSVIVDRSETDDIYKAMYDAYKDWHALGRICADITGGTKAMASSAAMMAAVLKMDIYYVESKYLPLYRRPMPGSEELKNLKNPSFFGEYEC